VEITEVRIKLVAPGSDKLRAFCSITIDDDFVVRDLKIIEGAKGAFVAMPSRKLTSRCDRCRGKNPHRAKFCNECGTRLRALPDPVGGRCKSHADVAHPINSRCREMVQGRVLETYAQEIEKSHEPGYEPMELDVFDEDYFATELDAPSGRPSRRPSRSEGHRSQPQQEGAADRADAVAASTEDTGAGEADSKAWPYRNTADRTIRKDAIHDDSEPEDNFGAGLFS